MATQVQVAVLNALETLGLQKEPLTGPPGSPEPVKVTPDTVARVGSLEGQTLEVDASGNVTTQ